jgi:hypothetical protein
VVIAVVMRSEKLVRLLDQVLVVVPDFLRGSKRGGAVGGDIHLDERVVGELDDFEEFAGDYGRIDERGQRCGLKCDGCFAVELIAGGGCDGQRRSEFPVGREVSELAT